MTRFCLRALLVLAPLSSLACGAYDPCSDQACGQPCTVCDPDDSSCTETAIQKVCNRNAVCTAAQPVVCG